MAPARRTDLEDKLRADAAAEWAELDPEKVDDALDRLPRAWTVADFALRVLADVNLIDQAVHGSRETLWYASREARLLFPPDQRVLEALSCAALAHVSRFEYRLDLSDLDEAEFLARQVFTLAEEGGVEAAAWVRASMAIARADLWRYRVIGDPARLDDAIECLEEPARIGDPVAEGLLAECLQARGEATGALADLDRARTILDRLLDPTYEIPNLNVLPWIEAGWGATWCLVELAAYALTGEEAYLAKAMYLGQTAVSHVLPSTAEAEEAHLRALLTWVTANGVTPDAEATAAHQTDIAIAAGTGRYWYALTSALNHAEWSLPRGWTQPATTSARIAYDIVDQTLDLQPGEEYRRQWVHWLGRTTAVAVPALAGGGAPGPAVSRLEQSRTRILSERFADDLAEIFALPPDLRAEVADQLAANLRVLRDPLAGRVTRSAARDQVMRAVVRVRQHPGLEFFRWKLEPDDLLRTIGDRPTVYLAPGVPHGVAILGGGPLGAWRSVPLPDCGPEPEAVTRFLERALSPHTKVGARRRSIDPITHWLGEAVWQPIADLLAGLDRLWLVPCGYLGLLPCHAGRIGADFALRRWDIRYAVTARSLDRAARLPAPPRTPTLVGLPESAAVGPNRLAGAEEELRAVAAVMPDGHMLDPARVDPATALEAIRGAGYLHAACHGVADPDDPMRSGLELGPGGRLTLRDLSSVRTGLELGVLSACETNVPDLAEPDEAMSLAVGLHLTGCRAVIASSWQVPDGATAALMAAFYAAWQGGVSAPEALRRAQLAIADDPRWGEPYYWAGFSFLGSPPAVSSRSPSSVST